MRETIEIARWGIVEQGGGVFKTPHFSVLIGDEDAVVKNQFGQKLTVPAWVQGDKYLIELGGKSWLFIYPYEGLVTLDLEI